MKDCLLLTEAITAFGFRDLRQARYFVHKHRGEIRQVRKGQRRWVNASDVARAILADPLKREHDDYRELWERYEKTLSKLWELQKNHDKLFSEWLELRKV